MLYLITTVHRYGCKAMVRWAGMVHPFYNKHRILPLAPDSEAAAALSTEQSGSSGRATEVMTPGLTGARLALMWAVQQVVRNGLNVLGVSAPEQM